MLLKNKDTNPTIIRNNFKNCSRNKSNNVNPFRHIKWPYNTLENQGPAIKNGQQYMEQDIGDKLMNTGEYNFGWNIGENVIYKNYQNDQDISQPPLTKNDSTDMNFFW